MSNELAKIESFRAALAKAETFEEIKFLKSQADAVAEFAKRLKLSKEKQDEIGIFRIEVEAEQGAWLERNFPRGVRSDRKSTVDIVSDVESMKHIGVNERQSSQSRLINREPELVKKAIEEIKETQNQVVTPNAVQKIVKKAIREEEIKEVVKKNEIPKIEQELIDKLKNGETIVININKHYHVLDYAKNNNLYIQIDRWTDWGNPFILGSDGDRDEVCNAYEVYFNYKKSLLKKLPNIKGKALGCHCYPERCHGNHLKKLADEL